MSTKFLRFGYEEKHPVRCYFGTRWCHLSHYDATVFPTRAILFAVNRRKRFYFAAVDGRRSEGITAITTPFYANFIKFCDDDDRVHVHKVK